MFARHGSGSLCLASACGPEFQRCCPPCCTISYCSLPCPTPLMPPLPLPLLQTTRLRGLQLDMGRGFETELELGSQGASLTVLRCFYHDLFAAEGTPQLTACSCCSQDQVGRGEGWSAEWEAGVEGLMHGG